MEFDWSLIIKPSGILTGADEVRQFESDLGFELPADYKRFLLLVNGGKITVDHDIHLPHPSSNVFVNYLYPLSAPNPFLGLVERRKVQVTYRECLRQALPIGDDMGPGLFFLILAGDEAGAVYFVFRDEMPILEGDWFSTEVRIPAPMAKVSPTFTALGEIITKGGAECGNQ